MNVREKHMKYESAYFCGYAKLPSALPTNIANGSLTIGLLIELETGLILKTSATLLSPLANEMVSSYFVGHKIIEDFDSMVEEVSYRHQGNASKPIIKALGDIRNNYLALVEKMRAEEKNIE